MPILAILSIAAIIAGSGISAYFLLKDKKKPVEQPIEPVDNKPIEKPIEQPIQVSEEPIEQPSEPEEPVVPVIPEVPEITEPEPTKNPLDDVFDYFGEVVTIGPKTREYISTQQFDEGFIDKDLFPVVYDYFGDKINEHSIDQAVAWYVTMVLSELVPQKKDKLFEYAYNYRVKGVDQSTYGWTFYTDPNISRMIGSVIYSLTRDANKIPELRKECGGSTLKFKSDISENFVDLTTFMPAAPGPYLSTYSDRSQYPVGESNKDHNLVLDKQIHEYISSYYNLDTKDAEKRQTTIQAIANKEHKVQHLFGKDRTVDDPKYGKMTFHPVFGKHNIGVEIPDNGAIAALINTVGMPCSNNRKSLLNQQYGRRRPGQGTTDPSANHEKAQRALVNYAIEEGDGHSTGFYNKNGDYVSEEGVHIGDFETYYQAQLYANSYPSGHSAYIWGVALFLIEVMPDKAKEIIKAANEFALSRTITRYHWNSDTIHGRVIGSILVPILHATANYNIDEMIAKAKEEYDKLKRGEPVQPEEKINTSLSYSIGGYGSCHVDAGEKQKCHCCNKECYKDRNPGIIVSQKVNFTIEGAGVTTMDGKTSGVWEANKTYYLICPKVDEGIEKTATITMRNENGVRVLKYILSRRGTHDDGPEN